MSFTAGAGKTNIDLIFGGVPRLPLDGEEIYSSDFSIQLGGGIPATLINLSRLGVPVKLATALGEDIFSRFAAAEYEKSGVVPENIFTPGAFPVNVTAVAITPDDRTFLSYGPEKAPGEQEKEAFYKMAHGADVVFMEKGYLDVYRRLKDEGSILVFDTGWDDEMTIESYREYLELADYYTPNQREAMKITGAQSPEGAAKILSTLFDKVVVKLDKAGCLGMENNRMFFVEEISSFRHVDSTGAGDAFLAGFVYGLYHGASFRECILYGNLTGGRCVTDVGCLSAYLTESELLGLAKENIALG